MNARARAAYRANPAPRLEAQKASRAANPERSREAVTASYLKRTYGITRADFAAMLAGQDGVCAICKRKCFGSRLSVDHDHALANMDEAVRGLLCRKCNAGLGAFADDPALLRAALEYLEGGR